MLQEDSPGEKFLAEGGFGRVYKSRKNDMAIIIKYVKGEVAKKYKEESKILESLNNGSIVGYKGTRQKGDQLGIEMEYCERGSLSECL
ncbi:unnamed protein product, partial [Mesorhabditis belari]|uniref:Protein kinase domain-containing protein n=1 Tax=Mesorhabditis belari TaxID=2138241 RepID=A0AAF3ECG1_9BILA